MKKAIIVGASSGIGEALAKYYLQQGYEIGITARRTAMLENIKSEFPQSKVHIVTMDVADIERSRVQMDELLKKMGEVDHIVLNAGMGYPKATFEQEMQTIQVNVNGFVGLATLSHAFLMIQGFGTLAGISSVAAVRSSPYAPEYHASKSFISAYMQGLNYRAAKRKSKVKVVDVRPGFVDTAMTKQNKGMFWLATPEKAAKQIFEATVAQKKVAYITKRYVLLAMLLKIMPDFIYSKVF